MAEAADRRVFTTAERQHYRWKTRRCLDALRRMLNEDRFAPRRTTMGLEIELNLVDATLGPAMTNNAALEKIDDGRFTTELAQHNVEINVAPRPLAGDETVGLEGELSALFRLADSRTHDVGAALVMIGMLPTLRSEHFDPKWLSTNSRYAVLNDEIFAARGEDLLLHIEGEPLPGRHADKLVEHVGSILAESACTSAQLHLQVTPQDFPACWNAAQCLAGVQVALAANSPFLLGKALWHETRIPLFLQATDTRSEELRNQGVRPRVWFGERWITSIFDLFEENVRYFPSLLPIVDEEDPLATLDAGRAPKLTELRLHNGTVWRWNRPVYDAGGDLPHLRVENRVLPAGPTIIDLLANAAFFYGAQRGLAVLDRPLWTRMSFSTAEDNFYTGARYGITAQLYWPGIGWTSADELVLRTLLPLAHEGLRDLGVSDAARERYLGVVENRCRTRQNGAVWQRETVTALEERGADRDGALVGMLARYVELMREGSPVHTWPIPGAHPC